MTDYWDRLYHLVEGYNARFPDGNAPFQIVARLCEEAGELASAVNHFEDTGAKQQKHGAPDRGALAGEVHDVIRTALSIARYYSVEREVCASIDATYERLALGGYLTPAADDPATPAAPARPRTPRAAPR